MPIRKAKLSDAPVIQAIIEPFADLDEMLHRGLGEICEHIRDYFVAEVDNEVLGCCSLHVDTGDLAEIKALAVAPAAHKMGLGSALVKACLEEARQLEVGTVYALTYRPTFFERLGFELAEKPSLPHKVWNECIRCRKFPVCGEVAMIHRLGTSERSIEEESHAGHALSERDKTPAVERSGISARILPR